MVTPSFGCRRLTLTTKGCLRLAPQCLEVTKVDSAAMDRDDLAASWELTRGHLSRAWTQLPVRAKTELYQEFLDQNELGLAMEMLAQAGMDCSAPASFWRDLADAATEMQESDKAIEFLDGSGRL